jgi:3'-phosphoadenosine 5'-phosphosulfate sulfotransferase (PAPS reductase)/FAD synthetase
MTVNMVSVSGGKDSTALLLLALALDTQNLRAVFADTGHEHAQTYEYVDYLEQATGVLIERVRADFSAQIARKREYVAIKWREEMVPEENIERALAVLHPTGNPFFDLCLWKGRFPSTKVRFCSEELKRNPIVEYQMGLMDAGQSILSWQGVRADESPSRARLPVLDEVGGGLWNYRPILRWTVEDVFEAHRYMGIKPNPLYAQGMGRVGCMPCIHARKDELLEISKRFPAEVERVAEWERIVSDASKSGRSSFFHASEGSVLYGQNTIVAAVEWSKTSRGGRQLDFTRLAPAESCSSIYGLCE